MGWFQMKKIRSLIVLLDFRAPSFCYYEFGTLPGCMSLDLFRRAVTLAQENDLALQLVCGSDGLPSAFRDVLGDIVAAAYIPAAAAHSAALGDVVFLEANDVTSTVDLGESQLAIVHITPQYFPILSDRLSHLIDRIPRVNVMIREIAGVRDENIDVYFRELLNVGAHVKQLSGKGQNKEVSSLTDRILMSNPTECGAGSDHVTLSPNGKLYLCPGFAVRDEQSLGGLDEFARLSVPDVVRRDKAPVCLGCDAYQCKRCIYINQLMTKELNTPPWQKCVISYTEREASRRLLQELQGMGLLTDLPPIHALSYEDPITRFIETPHQFPKKRRTREYPEGSICVGAVSADEREEIRSFLARRDALKGLLTLADNFAPKDVSELYARVITDLEEVTMNIQGWWQRVLS